MKLTKNESDEKNPVQKRESLTKPLVFVTQTYTVKSFSALFDAAACLAPTTSGLAWP